MNLNLHTKAEGIYKFFAVDKNNQLSLLGESENLITSTGLEYVKTIPWVDCFTHVRLGSSDNTPWALPAGSPPLSSTSMNALVAEVSATNDNPGFGTYVTGSFNPGGTGITYSFQRAWKVSNNTATDWLIKEVGAAPNSLDPNVQLPGAAYGLSSLFSHSYIPASTQIILSAGQSIITQYELRLTTTSVFSANNLTFFTDNPSYQIPSNSHGIVSCPFKCLAYGNYDQTVTNYTPANESILKHYYSSYDPKKGALLFEPSNPYVFAYFLSATQPVHKNLEFFNNLRKEFQNLSLNANPLGPLLSYPNTAGAGSGGNANTVANPALAAALAAGHSLSAYPCGKWPGQWSKDPTTKNVQKVTYRLTTMPFTPPVSAGGILISTVGAHIPSAPNPWYTTGAPYAPQIVPATNIDGLNLFTNSWYLVFNNHWETRNNTYLELTLTHTWS